MFIACGLLEWREMFQVVAWLGVGVKENRSDVDQEGGGRREEDWQERGDRVSCYFICGPALEHNTN